DDIHLQYKGLYVFKKNNNKRLSVLGMGATVLVVTAFIAIEFLAIYIMKTYNTFITLGERVRNAKAQITTQIESRYDAVKSLIEGTRRYGKDEAETLEEMIGEGAGMTQDTSIENIEQENDELKHIVGRLIAISDSYPELTRS